ncbi:MAG: PilZ domain-containing protein [Pyrinomonadaceae bacterium]
MTILDRRSGDDRRSNARRNVTIDVEWESDGGRDTGTVSDLSEAGCFVLCSGAVNQGDTVKLLLPLGDGMKVEVLGEVRNYVLEIGFALRFVEPTEAQNDVIAGLMAKYGENA